MANIKELKKRIKSTKGTLKITTAMKLVSAAKLAKAQERILSSRPYADELKKTIDTVSALIESYEHPYFKVQENKNSLILVLSSSKGLCGSYNSSLAKSVTNFIEKKNDLNFKVFTLGKKVRNLMKGSYNWGKNFTLNNGYSDFDEIANMASELAELFVSGEVGRIYVAYNNFKSAININPIIEQVLPFEVSSEEKKKLKSEYPFDYKYDVLPKDILDKILPESYNTTIYKTILDAAASEHGSRMTSMDNASKNCKEVIRSLTLHMNKLRQAAITTELIEVVSGAEALNG